MELAYLTHRIKETVGWFRRVKPATDGGSWMKSNWQTTMDRKLERWLDHKKERDIRLSTVTVDPYVDTEVDIFDLYREDDDGAMDELFDDIGQTGVEIGNDYY